MAFKYEILEKLGVIEESDNSDWGIALCRISWNGKPPVYDIRKYNLSTLLSDDEEEAVIMGKGVSLVKDESLDNLVHKLIELGFGDSEIINNYIEKRCDIFNEDDDFDDCKIIKITREE